MKRWMKIKYVITLLWIMDTFGFNIRFYFTGGKMLDKKKIISDFLWHRNTKYPHLYLGTL